VVSAVGKGVRDLEPGQEAVIDPTLGWGDSEECPTDAFDILGAPLDGTFAERVLVSAANVVPRPGRLSWEESAAMNLAGLTAWRAVVTCGRAGPGTAVLVTGAGGGVATFAVQIAVALGARVWVTSGSDEKIDRARAASATTTRTGRPPHARQPAAGWMPSSTVTPAGCGSRRWRRCAVVARWSATATRAATT
jgi:NADPH:quinone reductase-like Zn-dependent oxidoreductase